MKQRITYLLFAGALAVLATMLVHSAIKSKDASIEALRHGTVSVVLASRALLPGTKLDSSSIKLAPWPREILPPGAFTDQQAVLGKVVKTTLIENQPITFSIVEGRDTGGVLPMLIPDGMRAMSIPVDDVSDMAGLILPHSRVDVLVSTNGASGGNQRSKIVLQNAEVLAVAQDLTATGNEPRAVKVVTLLLRPTEVERLAVAGQLGTLHLAMRNFADHQLVETSGVSANELMGNTDQDLQPIVAQVSQTPHLRVRPVQATTKVEIIRNGKDRQTVTFVAGLPVDASSVSADPLPAVDGQGQKPALDPNSTLDGQGQKTALDPP